VLDEKIGEVFCAVLDLVAVLLLFMHSKFNLFATNVGPVKFLNSFLSFCGCLELDEAEALAGSVWVGL